MPQINLNFNPDRFFLILFLIAISIGSVWLTFEYFPQYSYFGAAVAKVGISITLFYLIDAYLLSEIETIEELKNGNIAYALVILAYAIIVGLALSTA